MKKKKSVVLSEGVILVLWVKYVCCELLAHQHLHRRGKLKLAKQIRCHCTENTIFHLYPPLISKEEVGIFKDGLKRSACVERGRAVEGMCVSRVLGGLRNKKLQLFSRLRRCQGLLLGDSGAHAAHGPGCDTHYRLCVQEMSFIWSEGERTLSSHIFGEAQEIWLATDKAHCHLALMTISPAVLVGELAVSPGCDRGVAVVPSWKRKMHIDFSFFILYIWSTNTRLSGSKSWETTRDVV